MNRIVKFVILLAITIGAWMVIFQTPPLGTLPPWYGFTAMWIWVLSPVFLSKSVREVLKITAFFAMLFIGIRGIVKAFVN